MAMKKECKTAGEVIHALGGLSEVARLTRRKYSAASNWVTFNRFPANTYRVMEGALRDIGKSAPASLWGMIEMKDSMAAENLEKNEG